MKKYILPFCLLLLLGACKSKENNTAGSMDDAGFDRFKNNFVENLWQVYPGWASSIGYHKYDSVLAIPDNDQRARERQFATAYLDSLGKIDAGSLSVNNRTDLQLMANHLRYTIWGLDTFKQYAWDPSSYNVADAFAMLLTEPFAPLNERLNAFGKKLKAVPAYYAAAQKNISNPAIPQTDLAIQQNQGALEVFTTMLNDSLNSSTLATEEKVAIQQDAVKAVDAIKGYVNWLQNDVRPKLTEQNAHSFRIGKEMYDSKFRYELQSSFTPEEIYNKAVQRKNELHDSMAALAAKLWPQYFEKKAMPTDKLQLTRMVLDTLASQHANRDSFMQSVQKQLPELQQFIKDKNLLYMDPSKPLVVRQTPDYQAGFSVASIQAPGPYDKALNTYYNVGSLKDYTPEMAESFLREYNKYTLQIINIHEAIPGHYTQLVYSNQVPSIIKAILGNNAMVEGWAVYTERMMLEEGYGHNDPALWLMYYKWHLRSVVNTILDYGIQVKGLTQEQALDLMTREAFQERAEAEGKWRRASLSQVQLASYFTGFTEIYALREEMKKKEGDHFDLKKFHEQFLSYGSIPVKYIRAMMLGEGK